MEKVIYQNQQGLGVILDFFEEESEFFLPKELVVNNELLTLDKETTLSDFFSEEVIFKGCLKDKPNCMVFYLGEDEDLFGIKKYYSCLYWINEGRIVNKYKEGTARDFIFVNGAWK